VGAGDGWEFKAEEFCRLLRDKVDAGGGFEKKVKVGRDEKRHPARKKKETACVEFHSNRKKKNTFQGLTKKITHCIGGEKASGGKKEKYT